MDDQKPWKTKSAHAMNVKLLGRSLLFMNLPPNELEYLANRLRVIEVAPKTVLFDEGDTGAHFYVVIYGEIEVIKALGTDDERSLAIRGPGDFVGELSLLNPNGLRTASVRARGPAQLWEITHEEIDALLQRQPHVAYDLMHLVSSRLSETHESMFRDLRERNRQLTQAYQELIEAQEQIVEKERLERELQVAYEIQMSILPQTLPEFPGYDFGARIVPARAVGGDFFDVFPLGKDKVAIVIGDVADKGVPSAIFMARTHALLYSEASHCHDPAEVLQRVNQHLIKMNQSNLFVTVLFALLNLKTGQLEYARAGHELPLFLSPDGDARLVNWNQGQLLGLMEDPIFDEETLAIPPGGLVLFYTDGIADGRNEQGVAFGYHRMIDEIRSMTRVPAQEVCDRLFQKLVEFQGHSAQDDDVTLVAVRSMHHEPDLKSDYYA
jgi:phosphoserine phosphatase RsbU/P